MHNYMVKGDCVSNSTETSDNYLELMLINALATIQFIFKKYVTKRVHRLMYIYQITVCFILCMLMKNQISVQYLFHYNGYFDNS